MWACVYTPERAAEINEAESVLGEDAQDSTPRDLGRVVRYATDASDASDGDGGADETEYAPGSRHLAAQKPKPVPDRREPVDDATVNTPTRYGMSHEHVNARPGAVVRVRASPVGARNTLRELREVGMGTPVGERFARAIAAKDAAALLDVLAPDVDFRAMTPGMFWEASSATEVVDDVILGQWFGPTDVIDGIESIENDVVVDRDRVGYRFRVTNGDGTSIVEQQAYYGVEDDRVAWLRIMCSGYRPVAEG